MKKRRPLGLRFFLMVNARMRNAEWQLEFHSPFRHSPFPLSTAIATIRCRADNRRHGPTICPTNQTAPRPRLASASARRLRRGTAASVALHTRSLFGDRRDSLAPCGRLYWRMDWIASRESFCRFSRTAIPSVYRRGGSEPRLSVFRAESRAQSFVSLSAHVR